MIDKKEVAAAAQLWNNVVQELQGKGWVMDPENPHQWTHPYRGNTVHTTLAAYQVLKGLRP
jgi:hypothetical protein